MPNQTRTNRVLSDTGPLLLRGLIRAQQPIKKTFLPFPVSTDTLPGTLFEKFDQT